MALSIQIISFVVSFLYGIFLSFLINLNYRFLFAGTKVIKIICNFLFALDTAMLYFLLMKRINYGMIHIYFYLFVFIGFILTFAKFRSFRGLFKHLSKSVNKKVK